MNGTTPEYPGAFVISLDFELRWGLRHHELDEGLRARLLGARAVIPRVLDLFAERDIAATWATVGMLFASSRAEAESLSPALRPSYSRPELDPYLEPVGEDETDDPLHYAASLIELIASTPRQEIASHTFSHYLCLEQGQDETTFTADLGAARAIAAARGACLTSLVFPANEANPAYLPALRRAGIVAYRGNQPGLLHRPSPRSGHGMVRRAARTIDCYAPLERSRLATWSELADGSGLCNVAASRFLRPYSRRLAVLEPLRLRRILSVLENAAEKHRIFHLWWHPHNFGSDSDENLRFLEQVLDGFDRFRARHGMESLTMAEVAERALGDSAAAGQADAAAVAVSSESEPR